MPTIYRRIILPSLRPVFFFELHDPRPHRHQELDLVMALTNGGPGFATDLPGDLRGGPRLHPQLDRS